jgi:hypothetical protein
MDTARGGRLMAVPAAHYLIEFPQRGKERQAGRCACAVPAGVQLSGIAEQLAEAEARGREEGQALARAELQGLLATERRACEDRIAADRNGWMAEQAEQLARALGTGLSDLEERVSASVGRILTPFLQDAVREKAVAEVASAVKALLAGQPAGTLQVAGPDALLDALRSRFAELPAAIEYVATEGGDVRIVCGSTLVESKLQSWAERLREAVG